MNSDTLIEQLGEHFYELRKLVNDAPMGRFVAYSEKERAFGNTAKEALENLLTLLNGND